MSRGAWTGHTIVWANSQTLTTDLDARAVVEHVRRARGRARGGEATRELVAIRACAAAVLDAVTRAIAWAVREDGSS